MQRLGAGRTSQKLRDGNGWHCWRSSTRMRLIPRSGTPLKSLWPMRKCWPARMAGRTRANRTWQMIGEYGILAAVARIVTRRKDTDGYALLVEMGMEDMTFEQVVLRHPKEFDIDVIAAARSRLSDGAN